VIFMTHSASLRVILSEATNGMRSLSKDEKSEMVDGFRHSGSKFIVHNVISDTVFIELAV